MVERIIKTKLWLDNRTLRDDRGQVKARISLGGSGAFVGTGVWVRVDEWDDRAERVLGRSAIAQTNRYNDTLARIKTAVDRTYQRIVGISYPLARILTTSIILVRLLWSFLYRLRSFF